jgi:hypothetical protein
MISIPNGILTAKKARLGHETGWGYKNNSGGVLLSHVVARVVSSALPGLTSEFGMVSGVAPAVELSALSYQWLAKGGMRFAFLPY